MRSTRHSEEQIIGILKEAENRYKLHVQRANGPSMLSVGFFAGAPRGVTCCHSAAVSV